MVKTLPRPASLVEFQTAAVGCHNLMGHGQADAGAFDIQAAGGSPRVNLRKIPGASALTRRAAVLDRNRDRAVTDGHREQHWRRLRGVLHRVVEQVS